MPFLPLGNLPDPGVEPAFLASLVLAGGFFTTAPHGVPINIRHDPIKFLEDKVGKTFSAWEKYQIFFFLNAVNRMFDLPQIPKEYTSHILIVP